MAGPPTPAANDRAGLRKSLRDRREAFVFGQQIEFLEAQPLVELLSRAENVGSYVAMKSEVDPNRVCRLPRRLCLPRISSRTAALTFHTWCEGDALESAPFGFQQPSARATPVIPDIVLTPLLAFDRAGNRLGQGAGHYDRYFASNIKALRIGLAWSVQEVDALAAAPWDMPLDAVQTEREWILPQGSRLTS